MRLTARLSVSEKRTVNIFMTAIIKQQAPMVKMLFTGMESFIADDVAGLISKLMVCAA